MIRKVKINSAPAAVKDNLMTDIRTAIGSEAFDALVSVLGGRQLYIPKGSIGEHHPITQAVGMDAALVLCREFAGLTVMLPVNARKRAIVVAALEAGEPVLRIAQRVLCSPRYVWKVKAELELAPREKTDQMRLF